MALASSLVQVIIDAVRKTARPMVRDFGEVSQLQVSRKGPSDFVTAADLKAEQTLFELLTKARPGYGFLGEERGLVEGTDKTHTWIVDPIDGTTNFMHAMPHFAITVALERARRTAAARSWRASPTTRSRTSCSGPKRARAAISTTRASAWRRAAIWATP